MFLTVLSRPLIFTFCVHTQGQGSPPKKPKSTAVTPTRKSVSRSRVIGINPNYANKVTVYETLVPEIAISIATKPKEAADGTFTYFIKKGFESDDHGDDLADDWGVISILPRRNQGQNGAGYEGVMPQHPGSKYDWKLFVHILEDHTTLEGAGKKLARGLTKFTQNKRLSGMETPEQYAFKCVDSEARRPLSFFLLDCDCIQMLKKIHGERDFEDVLADTGILNQFFETAEKGQEVLSEMGEEEWLLD